MFTRILRLALLPLLILGCTAGLHAGDPQTPETLIASLYKQHETKTPFFQVENKALLDSFFAKSLADALWKDAKESRGEVGALSFDPLFDSQDSDITYFTIHQAKMQGDTATVAVTFSNFGRKKKLVFSLVAQGDLWRITDIRYAKDLTLAGLLAGNH